MPPKKPNSDSRGGRSCPNRMCDARIQPSQKFCFDDDCNFPIGVYENGFKSTEFLLNSQSKKNYRKHASSKKLYDDLLQAAYNLWASEKCHVVILAYSPEEDANGLPAALTKKTPKKGQIRKGLSNTLDVHHNFFQTQSGKLCMDMFQAAIDESLQKQMATLGEDEYLRRTADFLTHPSHDRSLYLEDGEDSSFEEGLADAYEMGVQEALRRGPRKRTGRKTGNFTYCPPASNAQSVGSGIQSSAVASPAHLELQPRQEDHNFTYCPPASDAQPGGSGIQSSAAASPASPAHLELQPRHEDHLQARKRCFTTKVKKEERVANRPKKFKTVDARVSAFKKRLKCVPDKDSEEEQGQTDQESDDIEVWFS